MKKRARGRPLGSGRGKGAIQLFFRRHGGRTFAQNLYREFKSAEAIAEFVYNRFNLYCCGNSVRNMLKRYRIRLGRTGGDRRSSSKRQFYNSRGKDVKYMCCDKTSIQLTIVLKK